MKNVLLLLTLALILIAPLRLQAQCGLDIFIANDQSGSIDAVENSQGRSFITALMEKIAPLGTANTESRMAIAQWSDFGQWTQFNFPIAGLNYTTHLSDVIAHQVSPRIYNGWTDPYGALFKSYQVAYQTPVPGRIVNKILVLMTDAACDQIQPSIVNLATQIKAEGIYIMVLAIDYARHCNILQGDKVASPGGYFSAPSYAALQQQALAYIDGIIQSGCAGPPPPPFDLTIDLTNYTATNCDVNGTGTYTVDYTIHNIWKIAWNHPITISFYDGDPTLPSAKYITQQTLGVQNIAPGGNITGSFTHSLLHTATRLYAIVNFDGSIAANAPPLPADIKDKLLIEGERSGRNNVSNGRDKLKDLSCLPWAIIQVDVHAGSVGCDNTLNYAVELCNTGDTMANLNSVLPITPHPNFVLNNQTNIADSTAIRIWGTYYGGTAGDVAYAIATDAWGNIYMAGQTSSTSGIATPGSHQPARGGGTTDAFLVKFNSDGVRQWGTYYGGTGSEEAYALAIDAGGNIYISGRTQSATGISTPGSHQPTLGGDYDAFLVKFNSDGVRQWGTYYGGALFDISRALATDAGGNVYMAGSTANPTGMATPGSHLSIGNGGYDAFLVKFNNDGVRQWGTYYGGSGQDVADALATDAGGNIYMAGSTNSPTGIATPGSHQPAFTGGPGVSNAYLVKFNSNGVRQWATYYGDVCDNCPANLAVDAWGNIFLAGIAGSQTDISTPGSHQPNFGGHADAFLVKFNSDGVRQWGTYYGGSEHDFSNALATDAWGNIYLAGYTTSTTDISTPGSHQPAHGGGVIDQFLVKFNSNGVRQWGTYYGGPMIDELGALAIDVWGNIYLAAYTRSLTDIATPGSHQPINAGSADAYLVKFNNPGITLAPNECKTIQYIYTFSNVPPGSYNFSVGIFANGNALILPDSNFTAGGHSNLYGFNGAVHTSDNVTIAGNTAACPVGDQVSVAVSIPEVSGCGGGNYAQATVTINNTSGVTLYSPGMQLNLTGTGASFAGEPYNISPGLLIPSPNVLDPAYPGIPNALFGKSGVQTLPVWELPPGTSTFQVDILLGTSLTNLAVLLNNIPTHFNSSGQSNQAVDAQGVTILPNPTITGFSCPSSINAGNNITLSGISTSNASQIHWASSTRDNIPNGGTVSNPSLVYTPTAADLAKGFVAISLTATGAAGCENYRSCQVNINNVAYDYGDAPISYDLDKNTVPYSGASTLFSGIHLGALGPSSEAAAKNSSNALADGPEEDGLDTTVCVTRPVAGQPFSLKIITTNTTPTKAYASAFIDFNNDGDYLDDGETALQAIPIPANSNTQGYTLSFQVPGDLNSTVNQYFVRLRISTDSFAIRRPYGPAPQGEVEDHLMKIGGGTNMVQTLQICQGDTVKVGSNIYTASGTYRDTLSSSAGCDSIITTNLTVTPFLSTSIDTTICQGQSISVAGNIYSTSGTYRDTLSSSAGCDSSITTNLTVNSFLSTTIDTTICQGQSISVAGNIYSTSGTYRDTLSSSAGCDSIITTNLTVNSFLSTSIDTTICQGQSISVAGNIYSASGTYRDTLSSSAGCDSIITTNLTVNSFLSTTIDTTICQGQSISVAGNIYSASGTYRDTLSSGAGCDSIITTNLTVSSFLSTTIDTTICQGQSISVAGNIYSTSGTYRDTLSSSAGCDSIITTNLTVSSFLSTTIDTTICQGQSISVAGNIYSVSGTYRDTLSSSAGCDSIITTNLTVNSFPSTTIDTTICQGQSVSVGSNVYTQSGSYTNTLSNSAGCDSVVSLELTVLDAVVSDRSDTICEGESIVIGGSTFDRSGDYTIAFPVDNGCDSLVNLQLTVLSPPAVSASAELEQAYYGSPVQLLALPQDDNYNYTWTPANTLSDTDIYNPIAIITSDTWFTVTIIDLYGCSNTDSIRVKVIDDCYPEFVYVPTAFSPNGDNTNDCFGVLNARELQHFHLSIFNRWHEKVFESFDQKQCWDGSYLGQPAPIDVYVFQISFSCHNAGQVMKRGVLTLLR